MPHRRSEMKIRLGRETLTCAELAKLCGGILTPDGGSRRRVCSVCTDSREAEPGSAFLAIRGEKTDGHLYAAAAARLGAVCCVAEYIPENAPEIPFVIVDSVTDALLRLAAGYFDPGDCKKIAVTGSVGKTTTKEMIYSVLSERGSFRSEGNFNSVIGLPMTMLSLPAGMRYGVFELGLERMGDISVMSRLLKPDIAVITNVGSSHLEYAGSREALIAEKLSVRDGMPGNGIILLGRGNPDVGEALKGDLRVKTFSGVPDEGADFYPVNTADGDFSQTFDVVCPDRVIRGCRINTYGSHNLRAAVSAVAAGVLLGLDDEEIKRGLLGYETVGYRQKIEREGGVILINDCYNASPESMRATCETLGRIARDTGGRKFALLADMYELGRDSERLHAEVGRYFAEKGTDYLITFGLGALKYAEGAIPLMGKERVLSFPDSSDPASCAAAAAELLRPGDVITVKGSRGMRAERVSAAILEILKERESGGACRGNEGKGK